MASCPAPAQSAARRRGHRPGRGAGRGWTAASALPEALQMQQASQQRLTARRSVLALQQQPWPKTIGADACLRALKRMRQPACHRHPGVVVVAVAAVQSLGSSLLALHMQQPACRRPVVVVAQSSSPRLALCRRRSDLRQLLPNCRGGAVAGSHRTARRRRCCGVRATRLGP